LEMILLLFRMDEFYNFGIQFYYFFVHFICVFLLPRFNYLYFSTALLIFPCNFRETFIISVG
jgi:hypothetical protein